MVPDGAGHPANPSPFLGGDVRQYGPGHLAHIAVVGEGASAKDEKAVAIQAVLSYLIGKTGYWIEYLYVYRTWHFDFFNIWEDLILLLPTLIFGVWA